jgi:hypothetical protein
MNPTAESYVKLVLAVGQHDADYVDAYHGPEVWQTEAQTQKKSLDAIRAEATAVLEELAEHDASSTEEMIRLRHQYLTKQLQSLIARVEMLQGRKMTFDEESKALYDAVAPVHSASHFQGILDQLDTMLPGKGTVSQRYENFKRDFIIPREKLDAVFTAAIEECHERTRRYIALPSHENFRIEYVNGKPWSGYNWYKGDSHSLIQVNTDLPIFIDRAIDLAAHEGYPGHHVYNALLEDTLLKQRGWVEFSVYALFSPQSLVAEGTANFGIEIAFTKTERMTFERDVLFPLAGLDPSRVELYYNIHDLVMKLNYAGNEAARRYLNGEFKREQAAQWLMDYALMEKDRAEQRTRFFDKYRSYVINYNLGLDLVRSYIAKRGGTPENRARRWAEFKQLLSSPRLPSGLV